MNNQQSELFILEGSTIIAFEFDFIDLLVMRS